MEAVKIKIGDGVKAIVSSTDPDYDRLAKGKLYGYQDILEWEPDFEGESRPDDYIQRDIFSQPDYLKALYRETE